MLIGGAVFASNRAPHFKEWALRPFFVGGLPANSGCGKKRIAGMAKDQQLQTMLAPTIVALGYEFWGLEYVTHGSQSVLRVFIDKSDGIGVDDCALVSRQVSALLDVEDPIAGEYTLEVSSPGMDRPLFTLEQFRLYVGEQVRIRLRTPFEGRRNFNGRLVSVEEDEVVVAVDEHEYLLPHEMIDRAHLVPRFE